MKTIMSNQTTVQNCKPKKDMKDELLENILSPVITDASAENMDKFKTFQSKVFLEDESSTNSHHRLLEALKNLDLNDTKLQCSQHFDHTSDKTKSDEDSEPQYLISLDCSADKAIDPYYEDSKPHGLMPLNCLIEKNKSIEDFKPQYLIPMDYPVDKAKSNQHSVINVNHKDITDEGKSNMVVHALKTSNTSALPPMEALKKVNCIKFEDDLISCFSEMGLSEKPLYNELSSGIEVSSNKSHRDKSPKRVSHGKVYYEVTSPRADDASVKVEADLFPEQEICEHINAVKPLESTVENKLLHFDDQADDGQSDDEGFLTERGGTKKCSKDKQKEQKVALGKTKKMTKEEWSRHLKHMSGGLVVDPSSYKTLNISSGSHSRSFDYSSGQSCNFRESVFFDQNIIDPGKQVQRCHSDNVYSFASSHCNDDLLGDVLSYPSHLSFASLPNESTMVLGTQSQQNVHRHLPYSSASTSTLVDIDDFNSPSSEISSCHAQNSRSTSPESGYGSSPRLSPFSDDSAELHKYQDQSSSNFDSRFGDMRSLSPSTVTVQSKDELVDNWDMSIFDDFENSSLFGHQHTEEERQKISIIVQDLKKCEEYVKPNDTGMSNAGEILSLCPDQFDSEHTPNFLFNANAPYLQECSPTNVQHQQESSASVDVPLQLEHTQGGNSPPQVIVIYVPYAAVDIEKGQKKLKPILPKPLEGRPPQAESSKDRLMKTLDYTKVKRHQYAIYERISKNDKNIIYIENQETRQTNLHIAVIKQEVELGFSILEIHKQFNKNMSAVNKRDNYKKTALQYADSNGMTLFMEYLKDFGAK